MSEKNKQYRSKISRRSVLAGIGAIGSLGLAGCISLEGFFESSAVTVSTNNTSNVVSVKILSEDGTTLVDKKYDLKPNETPSTSYTGNASKIIVGVNGETVKKAPFTMSKPYCEVEQILVHLEENGTVSVRTSCLAME